MKMTREDEQCSQTADVCNKWIIVFNELPLALFALFESLVKKCFGSCVQSIWFWRIQRIHKAVL